MINEHFIHESSKVSGSRAAAQSDMSSLKERAYNLYNIREYKLAAKELEKVYETEGDWESLLYAAISNLGSGKIQRAEFQIYEYLKRYPDDERAHRYKDLILTIKSSKS